MNRRTFVSVLLTAPLFGRAGALLGKTSQFPGAYSSRQQQPPGAPPLPNSIPTPPTIDPHVVLVENQKNIKEDVNRLYELAAKLRKQVEKTDSSEVLSLNMIQTAEKIEKLAKHIRDLARG